MNEELDSFEGTITIGGRPITNLKFADDIDYKIRNGNKR